MRNLAEKNSFGGLRVNADQKYCRKLSHSEILLSSSKLPLVFRVHMALSSSSLTMQVSQYTHEICKTVQVQIRGFCILLINLTRYSAISAMDIFMS